jgi:hypothetical protein
MSNKKFTYPPGYKWRFNAPTLGNRPKPAHNDIQGDGKSIFDELVVDEWFHMERISQCMWWLRIGDALNIHIGINKQGDLSVNIDDYDEKGEVANMLDDEIKADIIKKLYSGAK